MHFSCIQIGPMLAYPVGKRSHTTKRSVTLLPPCGLLILLHKWSFTVALLTVLTSLTYQRLFCPEQMSWHFIFFYNDVTYITDTIFFTPFWYVHLHDDDIIMWDIFCSVPCYLSGIKSESQLYGISICNVWQLNAVLISVALSNEPLS